MNPREEEMGEAHAPVMVQQVVKFLGGRPLIVDMTLGAGGHTEALLKFDAATTVVGVDRDPAAIELAKKRLDRFGSRFIAVQGEFASVSIPELELTKADGVLYDLGVSSMQLDEASRGFSYRNGGPLDMRMGPDGPSALELVNEAPEGELSTVLWDFGEERHARNIARAIVRARERASIKTTDELTGVVASAVGRRKGGPHPARRTFQALRIAVNRELEELSVSLPRTVQFLAPGGRVVVISYHSLEDRIVKRFFRDEPALRVLTKKVVKASQEEIDANSRARSAVLRAAERIPDEEVAA